MDTTLTVHMENTEGNGGPQADCFDERELPEIKRELKEIKNISTDVTYGGPQADGGGEQLSINDD